VFCGGSTERSEFELQNTRSLRVECCISGTNVWCCGLLLTDDMLLLLWRALVVQVSKLMEMTESACVKSDKVDAFTAMLTSLRQVVSSQRFQPPQLLVSFICSGDAGPFSSSQFFHCT